MLKICIRYYYLCDSCLHKNHSTVFTHFRTVQVYEVFSQLALFARCNADSYRSSFTNELMMIVRKQVSWKISVFFPPSLFIFALESCLVATHWIHVVYDAILVVKEVN